MTRPLRRFVFGAPRLYHVYSRTPADLVVILQRGRRLEEVKAPEYRPFHRGYNKSFASRFGVDAERNSGGVCREKPGCEADQPRESFPVIPPDR